MTLKLVETLTRHGARAPATAYLSREQRGSWFCDAESAISPRMNAAPEVRPRRIRNIIDWRVADFRPNCRTGDLTLYGMVQHLELGGMFRRYLVDELGFLPVGIDTGILYVHTTHIQRTYDSAVSFMQGLYPPMSTNEILTMESGVEGVDYFQPNQYSCKDMDDLWKNYTASDEFRTYYAALVKEIEVALVELVGTSDVTPEDLCGICDFPLTYWCNNISYSGNMTEKVVDVCRKYEGAAMFGFYNHNKGVVGSPAMREIFRIMDESLGGESPVKFALLSSHDSTVAAVLTMLGYTDEYGPPYASHVVFEVWEDNTSKEMYIRVWYNGDELPLIGKETLVKLHEFRSIIEPLARYCPEFQ